MIIDIIKRNYQLILISLLGLLPLTWFKPGYIIASGDYFPLYLSSDTIFRDMFLWNSVQLGQPTYSPAYFLHGITWFVSLKVGIPVGFMQILTFTFYFIGSGLSMYYFAKVLFSRRKFAPVIASIFYMFNLFVVIGLFYHRGISFTYIFLPLLMALFVKIVKDTAENKGPVRSTLLFSFISVPALSLAAFNIPLVVIILLSLTLLALYYLISEKSIRYRLAINTLKLMCLVGLLNLWWIIPFLSYITSPAVSFSSNITDASLEAWTCQRSSFLNLFWLNPLWGWKSHYYPFIESYSNPILLFIIFIPTILAFSSLLFKTKERWFILYASLIVLISFFLAKGWHEPFSSVNGFLYENVPGMFLFRNPTLKFTQLALPFLALLVGFGCDGIISAINKKNSKFLESIFIFSFILIFVMSSFPLLTGQVIKSETDILPSSYVRFPDYWSEVATWLNNQDGDFRILLTPNDDFYQMPYTWGYYGTDTFPARLISKPVLGAPSDYAENPELLIWVSEIYDAIENNKVEKFELLLGLTNTKYILHRDDIQYNFTGRKILSPYVIKNFLNSQKDVKLVQTFGKLTVYEYLSFKPHFYITNYNQSINYNPFRYIKYELASFNFENIADLNDWKLNFEDQQKIFWDESSLKIELYNSTAGWKVIQSPLISTVQESKYRWTLFVKGENVSKVHAKIAEYNINMSLIQKIRVATIGGYEETTFSWKNVSFEFIPTFNTSYIALEIWYGKETTQPLPNRIWIDNITISCYKKLYPYVSWLFSTEWLDSQKINPIKYVVKVNATEPFLLAFAEVYDPLWIAHVNGERIEPIPLYSVINGFWINQTGLLNITIEYEPQRWFFYGSIISLSTFLTCTAYLAYSYTKTRNLLQKITQKLKHLLAGNQK